MDLTGALLGIFIILVIVLVQRMRAKPVPLETAKFHIGDITAETLVYYCGYDYMKPILVAVRGVVYDVTSRADLYGPGKELHVYAGKEISRALALGSLKEDDCGSSLLSDLGEEEIQRLEAKVQEMVAQRMDVVGQVVPMKEITMEELARHNGTQPELPMYLSIQGLVFNITKGKQFYGPDGCYPFAGHECARAFALLSTEVSDCNDNLEGLSHTELENLRDWKAKFNNKYPIVGRIVQG